MKLIDVATMKKPEGLKVRRAYQKFAPLEKETMRVILNSENESFVLNIDADSNLSKDIISCIDGHVNYYGIPEDEKYEKVKVC